MWLNSLPTFPHKDICIKKNKKKKFSHLKQGKSHLHSHKSSLIQISRHTIPPTCDIYTFNAYLLFIYFHLPYAIYTYKQSKCLNWYPGDRHKRSLTRSRKMLRAFELHNTHGECKNYSGDQTTESFYHHMLFITPPFHHPIGLTFRKSLKKQQWLEAGG